MAPNSSTLTWGLTWLFAPLSLGIVLSNLAGILAGAASDQLTRQDEQIIDTFSANKLSPHFASFNGFRSLLHSHPEECRMDRSAPPDLEELVGCRNSSMFTTWRPKARMIGPRGWMNDPMSIYQTSNGTYHVGYQCSPEHLVWANISQCSASTNDFVHFNDYGSWKNPITMAPSQLYDIRGVFDGTVIQDGWDGYPSMIYTSAFIGPFGPRTRPPETEGVETQSIAYTKDDGHTWIKLHFGATGNPAIYKWPEKNLAGFRDPFVFESLEFSEFYANKSIVHQIPGNPNALKPTGRKFLLLSGGIRTEADPINGGPRLFLYRQTEENNIHDWTYLGPLLSFTAQYNQPSEWTGGVGINFECGGLIKIDERGRVTDTETNPSVESTQLNVFTMGTNGARNFTHMDNWAMWQAASFDYTSSDGNVKTRVDFSGVIDWGRAYAFFMFPSGTRQLTAGWVYEDDDYEVLVPQRGSQGAFTLFREIFVKVIRNIHPVALQVPEHAPSWSVREEQDGTQSIITVGQRILPEITASFRNSSIVSRLEDRTLNLGSMEDPQQHGNVSTNVVAFETQPKDRYYAISAQLDFGTQDAAANGDIHSTGMVCGGFRILASQHEWTDIYYDPVREYLIIDRMHSSAIWSYGNSTEQAKHRLWPILNPGTNETKRQTLNLTIIVDNSVVEVHANEVSVITTRIYPWYEKSIGTFFFIQGPQPAVDEIHQPAVNDLPDSANMTSIAGKTYYQPNSVRFSNVELWDGLLDAWPNRPLDTSVPYTYNNNITSNFYGLWAEL